MRKELIRLGAAFVTLAIAFVFAVVIYDSFVVPSLPDVYSVPLLWWGLCAAPLVVTGLGFGLLAESIIEPFRIAAVGTLGILVAYHFMIGYQINAIYDAFFIVRMATASFFGLLILVFCGHAMRRLLRST